MLLQLSAEGLLGACDHERGMHIYFNQAQL